MKKSNYLVLVILLVMSAVWTTAGAHSAPSGNISFADANVKALCVANWDTDGDGELSYAEAAAVTDIGQVFRLSQITSFNELQFFTGLSSIANNAFNYCSLTSITIPSSVTSIGVSVFDRCFGLTSIEIPSSVTSIGSGAFQRCSALTSIEIPSSVTSISSYTFGNCSGLTSITIPNSVTSINSAAFEGCSALTSIEIPSSVTSIGLGAFQGCSALTSIEIPSSVTSIGKNIFSDCSSLTSIIVSEGNHIYDSRDNCNAIIETTSNTLVNGCNNTIIPSSVMSIGDNAFLYCRSMTSIEIPSSVTSIGVLAFNYCSSLTSVTSEITEPFAFGSDAFRSISDNCVLYVPQGTRDAYIAAGWTEDVFKGGVVEKNGTNDENIVFADPNVKTICVTNWDTDGDGELSYTEAAAVTDIGQVFSSNSQITSFNELQYFTGLSSIGGGVFSGCTGLTSVTIPNSVMSIGKYTFSRCSGLTSITIPNSVTSIGGGAFNGCTGLAEITIPNSVTSLGDGAFSGCSGLTSIIVPKGNSVYDSRDNCNAIIETASNTLISGCKNTIIPSSVTSIGVQAFDFCSGLISITIPNSVTRIGSWAFYECSGLTSITIPNSVTSIGTESFRYCSSLTSLDIPSSVTSIGEASFGGCSDLTSVTSEITEPFAFGGFAFYKISANCVLYVPQGTRDAYIAAGWTEDVFKGGVVEMGSDDIDYSTMSDIIYIDNVKTASAKQTVVPVILNNSTDISDIQFDLYLPEGVTLMKDPSFSVLVAGERADMHDFYYREYEDGSVRILGTSAGGNTFSGNTGTVLYITLKIGEDMAVGDYTIRLKDCVASNADSTFYLSDTEATLTVEAKHKLTFVAEGAIVAEYELAANDAITAPAVPAKTGHSGSWNNVPAVMPGEDLTIYATYTPNSYRIVFEVDGQEYSVLTQEYGTAITAADAPVKEGYTFLGWSEIPATVGAGDIVITAYFVDNRILALQALADSAQTACDNAVEGTEPGNYSAGAKAELQAVIDEVAVTISYTMEETAIVEGTDKLNAALAAFADRLISYTLGDINADGHINVGDLSRLVRMILTNYTTVDTDFLAADVNKDGELNVGDYSRLVQMILKASAGSNPFAGAAQSRGYIGGLLRAEPVCMTAGKPALIAVDLTNSSKEFNSIQFDVVLPEGITIDFDGITTTSRTEGMSVYSNGTRVVVANLSGTAVSGQEGAVLYLPLNAEAGMSVGTYEVEFADAVLGTVEGDAVYSGSFVSTVEYSDLTGIGGNALFSSSDAQPVYDLQGRKVAKPQKGNIYIINGKKVKFN